MCERSVDERCVATWAARDIATGETAKLLHPRDWLSPPRHPRAEHGACFDETLGACIQSCISNLVKAVRQDVLDEAAKQSDGMNDGGLVTLGPKHQLPPAERVV